MKKHTWLVVIAAAGLALPAAAQIYPAWPITMVVPFAAGGPGDVIARLLDTVTGGRRSVADDKVTPAALRAHLVEEVANWKPIIRRAGEFAD